MRTIWIQVSSWYGDLIIVIARMLLKKWLNMPAFIDRGFFCFLHIPVLLTSFSIFFWVFCKYFIVDLQSRMLDLSKITLKPGTQNAKLFVGLCATYLVCTTILSNYSFKIIPLSLWMGLLGHLYFYLQFVVKKLHSILSLHIHLFFKVNLLLSWIIKLINELNCNDN